MRQVTKLKALDVAGRTPPHALEAESAVLCAVLETRHGLDDVLDLLPDGSLFFSDAHGRIYDAARELRARGTPLDVATVSHHLRERGRLESVGGIAYLSKLVDASPAVGNVRAHAKIVREKWHRRRIILAAQVVLGEGYAGVHDDFGPWALDEFSKACANDVDDETMQSLAEVARWRDAEIREQWAGKREPWGLRLPWPSLHARLHGLLPGEVSFVAGQTAGGKSCFAQQLVLDVAGRSYSGHRVGCAYLTLEMPLRQLYDRALVQLSGVSWAELQTGKAADGIDLDPSRIALVDDARSRLREAPIVADDADKDLARVRAAARRAEAKLAIRGSRLRLLVVDHLHILDFGDDAENETQAIANTVRGLKRLAVERDMHVMVLCQYRKEAGRSSERPTNGDIRGAAAIEQIADKILHVHRPYVLHRDKSSAEAQRVKDHAEIIVGKHRNGGLGAFDMRFSGDTMRFEEDVEAPAM